jgi:hypothetical protein
VLEVHGGVRGLAAQPAAPGPANAARC